MSDFEARNRDAGSIKGLTQNRHDSEVKARTKAVQTPSSEVAVDAKASVKKDAAPRKVWHPAKASKKSQRNEIPQAAELSTDELMQLSRDAARDELDQLKRLETNQATLDQAPFVEKMSLWQVVEMLSKPGVSMSEVERLAPVPTTEDKAHAESAAVAELQAAQEEVSQRSRELERLLGEQARVEADMAQKMAEVYGSPNAFFEKMGRRPMGEMPSRDIPNPAIPATQPPASQTAALTPAPQIVSASEAPSTPAPTTPALEKETGAATANGPTRYSVDREMLEQIDAELERFEAQKKLLELQASPKKTKAKTEAAKPAHAPSEPSGKSSVTTQSTTSSPASTSSNTSAGPILFGTPSAFTFSLNIATQGAAPPASTSSTAKKSASKLAATSPIVFGAPSSLNLPLTFISPKPGQFVMAPAPGSIATAAKEMAKKPKDAAATTTLQTFDKIAQAQQKLLEAKARAEKARATLERLGAGAVKFVEVTDRQIRAIVPNFPEGRKGATILEHLNWSMRLADVTTRLRKAAYIAQLAHETGGFNSFEEIADGAQYQGRKNLGNDGKDCDGSEHKGRGPIMLTGCYNYKKASEALQIPLLDNPKLAARVDFGFWISAWYWGFKNVNAFADMPNFDKVTERVQGAIDGPHTYRERRWALYRLALAVLPEDPKSKPSSRVL